MIKWTSTASVEAIFKERSKAVTFQLTEMSNTKLLVLLIKFFYKKKHFKCHHESEVCSWINMSNDSDYFSVWMVARVCLPGLLFPFKSLFCVFTVTFLHPKQVWEDNKFKNISKRNLQNRIYFVYHLFRDNVSDIL